MDHGLPTVRIRGQIHLDVIASRMLIDERRSTSSRELFSVRESFDSKGSFSPKECSARRSDARLARDAGYAPLPVLSDLALTPPPIEPPGVPPRA